MKDAMAAMAKANANMMAAIGTNSEQTKVLTGRVDDIGQKADRIIEALEKHGMVFSPDAPAPTTAPAAAPAPAGGGAKPPAQNAWMTATSGGGRGGGSKKRPGRGMGGTVSEDYDLFCVERHKTQVRGRRVGRRPRWRTHGATLHRSTNPRQHCPT